MDTQRKSRFGILLLLVGAGCLSAANMIALDGEKKWQIGDFWKVGITLYSRDWMMDHSDPTLEARKNVPTVLSRYIVEARVAGVEDANGTSCWKLEYRTEGDEPRGIGNQRYYVWMSQADYSTKKLVRIDGKMMRREEVLLSRVGNVAVMPVAAYGFPLESIPSSMQKASGPNGRGQTGELSITVTGEPETRATRVGLVLKRGIDEFRITQVWPEGVRWWGQYVKHYNGHIEMEASTLGPWLSSRFNELHQEWRRLNNERKSELAGTKYAEMKNLGIAAVPYIIEKVKGGDPTLIPMASELSSGQLKADATRAQALEWWEANKAKWLAPFPSHEPDPPEEKRPRRRVN
jgi:hypothetical protein